MVRLQWLAPVASVLGLTFTSVLVASCSSDPAATGTPPVATSAPCGVGDAAACPPPPCPAVFVAPTGSDGATGCAPTNPLKTLQAAIGVAKANHATEIRACKGAYTESAGLVLDAPVSLHGGFACDGSSWTRGELPPLPTVDDALGLSVLTGGSNGAPALFVRGDMSQAVTIDGLEVRAAATPDGSAIALSLAGSASPHVTRSRFLGGAGVSKNGVGSIGIVIEDTAAPVIDECVVDGGSGESTSGAGSIGVLVRTTSGAPRITKNRIGGGNGKEHARSVGSVGVWIEGAPVLADATAIADNTIEGGDGTSDTGGIPSIGLITRATSDLDVTGNRISGGSGHTSAPDSALRALYSIGSGGLRVKKNRIFGGLSADHVPTWAIDVRGARAVDIANNFVLVPEDGHGIVIGIDGDTVEGARVRYNTVLAHTTSASLSGFALFVGSHARHAAIVDNLLIADFGTVKVDNCPYVEPKELIADLRGNAWVNGGLVSSAACAASGPGPVTTSTVTDTDAAFAGAMTGNNVRETSTPEALFEAWTIATSGKDELLGAGWKLGSSAPCTIAQGGVDLGAGTSPIDDDALGNKRTPSPGTSMGADEDDGACR